MASEREVTRWAIDVMTAWIDDRDNNQETCFVKDRFNAYTSEPGTARQLLAGFVNLTWMLLAAIKDSSGETPRLTLQRCSRNLDTWDKEDPSMASEHEKTRWAIDVMTTWDDNCEPFDSNSETNVMLNTLFYGTEEEPARQYEVIIGFVPLVAMLVLGIIQKTTSTPPRETLQRCSAILDAMDNQASSPPPGGTHFTAVATLPAQEEEMKNKQVAEWKYTVEDWGKVIQNEEEMDLFVKRDQLVDLLHGSDWYQKQENPEESDLGQAIKNLKDAASGTEVDTALWEIYNLADSEGAWLDPSAADDGAGN